jgi:methylmalonyl-CoA mutase
MSADPDITGLAQADLTAAFPPATESDWKAMVETALKGRDFDKVLRTRTPDGFVLDPLYGQSLEQSVQVGRSQHGPWSISQRVDHPDAEQAAGFALADLEGGADGLTLVSKAAAAANGFGLDLDVPSLGTALKDVLLDIVRLRLDAGPERLQALDIIAEIARSKQIAPGQVHLDPGFDPAADLANGLADAMPVAAHGAMLKGIANHGFGGTIGSADGRIAGDAGASDSQELALALAGLLGHLRAAEDAGLDVDESAGRLEAIVTAGPDTFASLTKMRAARMLYARLLESAGLAGPPVRLHAETAWAHVSATDPYVNMLRATSAVAGAGLGGADSILTQPLTAALGLADGFSRRMARNIQLVLIEESFLDRVSDPAAGAGYLDQRTIALSEAAWGIFQKIESEGGLQDALKSGLVGDMIESARTALQSDLASRVAPLTGVTEFASATEGLPDVLEVSPNPCERKSSLPGVAPYVRGPYPTMYVQRPGRAPICGFFHRRRLQRLLPAQPCRRAEGPIGRFRSGHAPGL